MKLEHQSKFCGDLKALEMELIPRLSDVTSVCRELNISFSNITNYTSEMYTGNCSSPTYTPTKGYFHEVFSFGVITHV